MSFRKLLKELIDSVPGSTSAVFVDHEGETVEQVSRNGDSYHIRFLGAHHGILLNSVKRISDATKTGTPRYMFIKTEKLDYFTAPVHDGYFIVLAVESGFPPGRAHLVIDRTIRFIRKEMGY